MVNQIIYYMLFIFLKSNAYVFFNFPCNIFLHFWVDLMPVPTVENSTKLCSRSFWIHRVKKLSLRLWSMSCSFNYSFILRKMQLGTGWIFTVSHIYQIKSLKILWWTLRNLWNCSFFVIIELQLEIKFAGVALVDMRFGSRPKIYSPGHSRHLDTVY